MTMVKSLILGSAAGLVAMGGAQAADLPIKAKPIEYVKICSLYGPGFYYIPGTDTCLRIGGYLRADLTVHGGNGGQPFWSGDGAVNDRFENQYNDYSRLSLYLDSRTATEYGVVRTYGQADFSYGTEGVSSSINFSSSIFLGGGQGSAANNFEGAGYLNVEYLFIQFAGFTFGKSASAYSTPWQGYPGNMTAFLTGGYDTAVGLNNIQYTAQFGNGVSATIGIDDSSANDFNRTQIFNAIPNNSAAAGAFAFYGADTGFITAGGTSYSGTMLPDLVGNIRVDQAWGLFQVSGALHDVSPGYWDSANTIGTALVGGNALLGIQNFGHPDSKLGGAVSAALQIKNLPTGAGDDVKLEASASLGASKYVLGTSAALGGSFYMFGDGPAGTSGKIALGAINDAVYAGPAGPGAIPLQLTQGWGLRGAFNHNWDPYWSTSLFGGMSGRKDNSTAVAAWCTAYMTDVSGFAAGPGFSCNPGFTLSEIGLTTRWTPVKNLTFSSEVLYAFLHTEMSGQASGVSSSTFPINQPGLYQYGDKGTVSVEFRAQRNF